MYIIYTLFITQKHTYTYVYTCAMHIFSYVYEKPGRIYKEMLSVVIF